MTQYLRQSRGGREGVKERIEKDFVCVCVCVGGGGGGGKKQGRRNRQSKKEVYRRGETANKQGGNSMIVYTFQ